MRLIDADALVKRIYEDGKKSNNPSLMMLVGFVTGYVNKQQEAIVRCKDCHYRNLKERPILCQVMSEDWFCADGRRKGE